MEGFAVCFVNWDFRWGFHCLCFNPCLVMSILISFGGIFFVLMGRSLSLIRVFLFV